MKKLILTVLGCGTSTGVPLIHCKCSVCRSRNPKNRRLRASAWIQVGGKSILIDTSPDFREQAIRAKIPRIDAVLYTHPHADHCHGIDDLRSFNFIQKESIPLYGNRYTIEELQAKFSYIFKPNRYAQEGGGIPSLIPHAIDGSDAEIEIASISVTPIAVPHGSRETLGYRIGSVAYVTDCNDIPSAVWPRLEGLQTLVLDCLRLEAHGTHMNLDRALEVVSQVRPKRTFLTHLGHDFDYRKWSRKLPRGVALAYDGLKIKGESP